MATFQVVERGSVMSPDLFGVWQSSGTAPAAFAARGARGNIPQWRVDLSESGESTAAFGALEASLYATGNALRLAETRLADFVAVQQSVTARRLPATFASAPKPEAELNRLLFSASSSAAFGLTDWFDDWKQAFDEFIAFAQQIQQHVMNYAWVDTRIADVRVGVTRVTWGGDFETVLADARTGSAVHQAALRAALLSRQQLLKQFVAVIRGAGQLAALALIAANPVLALPAALRFLKLLFDEILKSQNE
ncbi:MAG: hypothetical protein HY741_26845 [Chloroflexi bacterium]|nr:hypothetical protein [Chloroflexota bacterium]